MQTLTVEYKKNSNGAPYLSAKIYNGEGVKATRMNEHRDYSLDANAQADSLASALADKYSNENGYYTFTPSGRGELSSNAWVYLLNAE